MSQRLRGLVVAVRQPSAGAVSDVRLRNLATLKTSTLNGCRSERSTTGCLVKPWD